MAADIEGLIRAAAERYNLDHGIFRRLLVTESGLNPNAINPKTGAAGIGQFMQATARGIGIDPMDPTQAIPASAQYLREGLNKFGGDYTHALASYNWGPGNVARHGVDNMPAETRNYVAKILGGNDQPIPVPPIPPSTPPAQGPLTAGPDTAGPPLPLAPPTLDAPPGVPGMPAAPTSLADAFTMAATRAQGLA